MCFSKNGEDKKRENVNDRIRVLFGVDFVRFAEGARCFSFLFRVMICSLFSAVLMIIIAFDGLLVFRSFFVFFCD